MNTPKSAKVRRFDEAEWYREYGANFPEASMMQSLRGGIHNVEMARGFTEFVNAFSQLEHDFEMIIRVLIGCDGQVSSIISRSLISVRARIEMARSLLYNARRNSELGSHYDDMIYRFEYINIERNRLVHAKYWTDDNSGRVFLSSDRDNPRIVTVEPKSEIMPGAFYLLIQEIGSLTSDIITYHNFYEHAQNP
jgi:hypothetical protein